MRPALPSPHGLPAPLIWLVYALLSVLGSAAAPAPARPELAGVTVTPHVQSTVMRYRRPPDPELGARVQLFVRNAAGPNGESLRMQGTNALLFRGRTPAELIATGDWAWHDTPGAWPDTALVLPPGAMTVWTFNSRRSDWGVGKSFELRAPVLPAAASISVALRAPESWLSAVTFLGDSPFPDTMLCHVANESADPLRFKACRLWLPETNTAFRVLTSRPWLTNVTVLPTDGVIAPGDKGLLRVTTGRLPLAYAAVEVVLQTPDGSERVLWAHLRIRRETFDISGGWLGGDVGGRNALTFEPFLKTLRRMHVNTAHIAATRGYTDDDGPTGLYTRYPLKYFNALRPFEAYDTDAVLPRIHAVEFLGEPQYGGGRPVPPQEVWEKLAPYAPTRLPTSVTHSEERIWRYYAGLSDYPHYDAYRVTAPAADSWRGYDRWGGQRIGWGAPLETIGELSRSLRELNRPAAVAYWSQGPHAGWDSYGGRKRTSPTPDEIRRQAYHALSSRITSLYWFNLSLKSLVKWRDTFDELTRVGREIRMLDEFYVQGDAYRYRQLAHDGKADWDLASIVSPDAAVLFALDLDYVPDAAEKVFQFGTPRPVSFGFDLPVWLRQPTAVFRIDADGVYDVAFASTSGGVEIRDTLSKVGVYVATRDAHLRSRLEQKRVALVAQEEALHFDPARNDADFDALRSPLTKP